MTISGNPPKWKIVENTVAAIERSLNLVSGTKVIPNASVPERVSDVLRQVDVYLEIPTGPRMLRIGVEVRDKAVPLDLPEVEQLIAKLKKLDLDFGCIVSRAGFTNTASEEANRNGIELRTIAEVEEPDWWRASEMKLDLRQIELVHLQVNFQPEELPLVKDMSGGTKVSELLMTLDNGESGALIAFALAEGVEALNRSELAHLKDQDIFTATIDLRSYHGGSLKCPRGPLPLPQSLYVSYRLHHRTESVKLAAYEGSEGVNAFTGISTAWGKQITVVARLESNGSRTLTFTTDDPHPSKTSVSQRTQKAEPTD